MSDSPAYVPPKVWTWNKEDGGQFAKINRPTAGATHERALPVGRHPLQLYSLATPNGVKVTVMLEELLAKGHAGAELLADVDGDDPRVVLGAGVALGEQLLEHHRDLHAVRRRHRVELKWVAADGQLLLLRRARDRAVDVREATSALLVPGPNLGRRVGGRVGHGELRSSFAAIANLAVWVGDDKGCRAQ